MRYKIYDLSALAADKTVMRSNRQLSQQISQYQSACSVMSDLHNAYDAILTLDHIIKEHPDIRRAVSSSLMMRAIIMYARAGGVATDRRRQVNIQKDFTPEQRVQHKDIMDLRNTAVAHAAIGVGPHAERWEREKVILKRGNGEVGIALASSRAGYLELTANHIIQLVTTAIPYVENEVKVRRDLVYQTLQSAIQDPEFERIVYSFEIDLTNFYSDAASAEKMANSFDNWTIEARGRDLGIK